MKPSMMFLVAIALVVLAVGPVQAAIVGVSPARIEFQNVLRGGFAERPITVTIDSEEPVSVELEALGDIGQWLRFSEENFSVSRNNPQRPLVSVLPPEDMPNGVYNGFIRVSTSTLPSNQAGEGSASGIVEAVVDLAVTVEITDIEVSSCRAEKYSVKTVEQGEPLGFEIEFSNTGNVRLRPDVVIEIWDQEQVSIVKSLDFTGREILPTRTEKQEFILETGDMGIDQYWAEVSAVDCFSSRLLTFDILEEGALRAEGRLLGFLAQPEILVGKTVSILALFKNVGEKDVDAHFEGQITRDGDIVQVLDSPEQEVAIGDTANYSFFFTPSSSGTYIVSGRVFYDKKRTFESSMVIDVFSTGVSASSILYVILYVGIFGAVLVLYYFIRKERKRYFRYFRKK